MSGIFSSIHQVEYTDPGQYTWTKPPGIIMVYILVIGPGGAGGSRVSLAGGTNRAGGGGGGGGNVQTGIFPAMFLPDTLYIVVGNTATGQVGGGTVSTGTATLVKASSLTNEGNYLFANAGSSGNGAAQGSGASAAAASNWPLGQCGIVSASIPGGSGAVSTAGAAGGNVGVFNGNLTTGGCGGGGVNTANTAFAGGFHSCTNPDIVAYAGGSVASPVGSQGHLIQARGFNGFYSISGTGGAGSATGAGGAGGNGGPGCGGGGSGANTNSSASVGGDGGNGYVFIQCI